jgi:hypothetical protein
MADTTIDAIRVIAKPITIPEHNEYPEARPTIDSGEIFADGDKVKVFVKIFGADNVQRGADKVVVYRFPKMPKDPTLEIIGAINISFVESPKPIVTP